MKLSTILCSLALRLITLVHAAPSTPVNDLQVRQGADVGRTVSNAIFPSNLHALNSRGYDPSFDYHAWGLVEIWTGGNSRKPINYGDLRGKNLSDVIFTQLDFACPASKLSSGAGCCKETDWQWFYTNSVVSGDPEWKVELRQARVRVNGACFHSEWARIRLMQLAADTLRGFTRIGKGYNCYDIPGEWAGVYCNVPQFVRVNLAAGIVAGDDRKLIDKPINQDKGRENYLQNYMHIETWSTDARNQFGFTKGDLKPCKTRHLVDEVMDKYKEDLTKLLPQYGGWWHREAKVIINGYKSCTDEP